MYAISWPQLAVTLGIELLLVAACTKLMRHDAVRMALSSIPLNVATQPLFAAWLRAVLEGQDYLWWRYFILGEIGVWLAEGIAYVWLLKAHRNHIAKGLSLSATANGCSLLIGLLFQF